ncbi:MAG: flagellar basal body-associated FliL family protein [Candidatus Latescibacteria bacterium]|nr:flagellar basal body-associated FliL family protein [Candidatus Latescibacterota bacterium]
MAIEDDEILDDDDDEELNVVAIAVAALVLIALIGGIVWFFFIREVPKEDIEEAGIPGWEAPDTLRAESVQDFLPTMIINPLDSGGRYFLLVKVDVAINDEDLVRDEVLNKPWRVPQVKNLIIDVFSVYSREELRTPKVVEEAREEILAQMNAMLGWTKPEMVIEGVDNKPPIKTIYFSEYVIQ